MAFARWSQCAPHLTHASLGPAESTTQTASRSVQPFCTAHRMVPLPLYFTTDRSSPKIVPSRGGSGPRPLHSSLGGSTRVLNANAISIGSAVSVGSTTVTDRHTYRQTDRLSVTTVRIYARSTAKRPITYWKKRPRWKSSNLRRRIARISD